MTITDAAARGAATLEYPTPNLEDLPPCDVLRETVATRMVRLPGGGQKQLTAEVGSAHGRALYETVLRERPDVVIEIGMAQAVSTLCILTALAQTGGRLISVDPYVGWPSGKAAALHSVERAGFADHHQFVEAMSCEALPKLLADGVVPQLCYIDGAHDFANAFIDFFYFDMMMAPGGIMGFNDAGWPDVHRVISFLKKHRNYNELDVGLKADYSGRNALVTAARWTLGRPRQDRYFRKCQPDDAE